MSTETAKWLNRNVLVGYTDKRGKAWHYRKSEQGDEPNHYPGAIPLDDVIRRLFYWTANTSPVYMRIPASLAEADGVDDQGAPYKTVEIKNKKAIYHSETLECFNVFGKDYCSHQFAELTEIAANLIDDDINIGSAGLLKKGAIGWVLIERPESIEVIEGFPVRSSILFTTSHNGAFATRIKPVNTFVVCDNTHAIALRETGAQFTARHSKNSNLRIQSIRDALGFIQRLDAEIEQEIKTLADWKVTDGDFAKVLDFIVPTVTEGSKKVIVNVATKRQAIANLYKEDPRVAPWSGTALGVLQAFNTYNHHNDANKAKQSERNMMNLLGGKTFRSDLEVLTVLRGVS